VREATELAEAPRGFFVIERGEGVGFGTVGPYSKAIEKGAADQMRRLSRHRADAEIDARLSRKGRQQLRMRVGNMENARIAEALEVVRAGAIGRARNMRRAARERGPRR